MHAPRITFSWPLLTGPYFSLGGLMESPKKRMLDQLLSGWKDDDQALQEVSSLRDMDSFAGFFNTTGGAT